jgi:hypothetical protein
VHIILKIENQLLPMLLLPMLLLLLLLLGELLPAVPCWR